MITSVEQKEKSKGNEEQARYAKEYCGKVEGELYKKDNNKTSRACVCMASVCRL